MVERLCQLQAMPNVVARRRKIVPGSYGEAFLKENEGLVTDFWRSVLGGIEGKE